MRARVLPPAALLGAWAFAPSVPAADPPLAPVIRFTGGLADAASGSVYLRHKADAIQAADLRTGEVRWESKEAFLPLGTVGTRLAALGRGADGPVVVLFDPKGKVLVRSAPLPRNAWIAEGPTSESAVTGEARDGSLVLRWTSCSRPFNGIPPKPADLTVAVGEAHVGLDSGKVRVVRDEFLPPPKAAVGEPYPAGLSNPPPELPAAVVKDLEPLARGAFWPQSDTGGPRPLAVGDRWVLITYERAAAGRRVVARSWDRKTGKASEPLTLVEGPEGLVIAGQGEYVFVDNIVRSKGTMQRTVHVCSLRTGGTVGKLPDTRAFWPVGVAGDRLLRTTVGPETETFESVDLETGKTVWARPFFRYRYKGQLPPAAPGR